MQDKSISTIASYLEYSNEVLWLHNKEQLYMYVTLKPVVYK